jgi:hypothetical protein
MKSPTNTEVMTSDAVAGAFILADSDAGRKRYALTRAQLASKGYNLQELDDGTFLISRWAYYCEVASIAAAARFLEQICGAK